jgi:hypothetical protein
VTDDALVAAATMRQLTALDLGRCPGVTALTSLACSPTLHTLDVSGCAVGDHELAALAGDAPPPLSLHAAHAGRERLCGRRP